MANQDVASFIEERKRNTRSVDEQIEIAHEMWDSGIDQTHEGLKRKEIEDELGLDLDYRPATTLHHLEEIHIVEEFVSGPPTLVIAEWMDDGDGEVVLGEVDEAAREGLSAVIDHLDSPDAPTEATTAADGSGVTLRSVIASELDLIPDSVEDYLRTTAEPVDVLNTVVEAVDEEDDLTVQPDYGEIAFINTPYRYRLTQMAINLYNK